MDETLRNLRFALRSLLKSPVITAVAVLALGLGIGANTAIFSVLHGVLLSPLPYPEPERLVRVIDTAPELGFDRFSASPPNWADWRSQASSFDGLAALNRANLIFTADGVEASRIVAANVSADFFPVMGLDPVAGRFFTPAEDRPGEGRVAVLSHGFWERRFASDAGAVGQTLTLSGEPYEVVGVAPADLEFPSEVELYVPLALEIDENMRGAHFLNVIGRLAPGVSLEAAQAEMDGITRRLAEDYPDENKGWGVNVYRMSELMVEDVKAALWVLMATVGMVLLVACANVANVLLARMSARSREVALRSSLGASRGQLVRLFLTESLLLSLAGGALGVLLAYWGTEVLLSLAGDSIPRAESIGISAPVLGFTFLLSVATGVLFGLGPALAAARSDIRGSLSDGGRGVSSGRAAGRVRRALVLGEVALALLLLVGAGLLLRSFQSLKEQSPGFEARGALTLNLSLPETSYEGEERQTAFFRELTDQMAALPGVDGSGLVFPLPLGRGRFNLSYTLDDRPFARPSDSPSANIRFVTPGTFEALGIPLVKGRDFTESDGLDSRKVALVNQSMARRMWGDTQSGGAEAKGPIETRFTFSDPNDPEADWYSIVGIVGDIKADSLETEPEDEIYISLLQNPNDRITMVIRGAGDRLPPEGPVRDLVSRLDGNLPLYEVASLEDVVANTYARERFNMVLLASFAVVALLLAAIGVYGVVSYSVSQRSHEMGLRMALGARPGEVLALVVRQGMLPVLLGLGVGLVLAPVAGKALEGMLFGVEATDVLTLTVVPLLLALVALLATLVPALRATRVEPVVVLREG